MTGRSWEKSGSGKYHRKLHFQSSVHVFSGTCGRLVRTCLTQQHTRWLTEDGFIGFTRTRKLISHKYDYINHRTSLIIVSQQDCRPWPSLNVGNRFSLDARDTLSHACTYYSLLDRVCFNQLEGQPLTSGEARFCTRWLD